MKLILAIVKPFKVTEIVDALQAEPDLSGTGLSVSDVRGFGREKTEPGEHPRGEDLRDYTGHSLLISAVPDDRAPVLVELIRSVARTGLAGDGKVFVLDLDEAVRIRTGERGEAAL